MERLIYLVIGTLIGIGVSRFVGKTYTWKKILLAILLTILLIIISGALVDQFPCFMGVPNCD